MKIKLLTAILLTMSATTFAAGGSYVGMTGIDACEDATWSNNMSRTWLTEFAAVRPTTDSAYFTAINQSPWCYVVPDKDKHSNHSTVMQYNSNHTSQSNGVIHKSGEKQWIANNWGSIKSKCTMPYDIYNGAILERAYRVPNKSASACLITKGTFNNGLHQQGKKGSTSYSKKDYDSIKFK